MKDNDNGGPAFPEQNIMAHGNMMLAETTPGMTLRDWFAGQALPGYVMDFDQNATGIIDPDYKAPGKTRTYGQEVAKRCYAFADAMLAARKQVRG